MSDAVAAREWLTWLYGERPEGLLWIGGHGDGFGGRTFTEIDPAVDYAMQLDAGAAGGVYHRLTTMRPVERGRGAAADSAYLPAFALDLDLRGSGHKALNYPESEDDLIMLLRKAGLPEPTTWVHSGGGRYPFWKLEESIDLTLPGALQLADRTSKALRQLVKEWADESGWKIDNTSDLARVYRLPGTTNRKGAEPVVAHVLIDRRGSSRSLGEMADLIRAAPRPAPIDPGPAQKPERVAPEQSEESGLGGGALFGQTDPWSADGSRPFNLATAMAFVQPALEALRDARDGEINVQLNNAAIALAHFGEEFWSREAAVAQLEQALGQTDYDGLTWRAADTIDSAYRADSWRAIRLPDSPISLDMLPEPAMDAVDALLAEMLTPEQMGQQQPPAHLIRGLLTLDSESWMVGGPGSKKSFVALDMAAHISLGRKWQGLETSQGSVVFIVAEGAGGSGKRVRAWVSARGQMGDVRFLPRPVQAKDGAAWKVLVEACRRIGPALVVLDTQARVTVGLEENSATEMGIYVERVRAIREATRACVLTIHHTGRKGADARGSSALDGAQSTELTVDVPPKSLVGKLRVTKQKDLDEADDIPLRFKIVDLGQDVQGADVTSLIMERLDEWASVGAESALVLTEDWARNWSGVAEQILTVLVNQGGEIGLTKAEAKRNVAELFYGGQVHRGGRDRPEGALVSSTFDTAWTRVQEAHAESGEPIVINVRGEKFAVDPVARAAWKSEHNS